MKAVIYARYSSANQREASIEQQMEVCKKYAADHGFDVIGSYTDNALTGQNVNRPGFQQMIKDAAKETFQIVIVYSTDRFSRQKYESAIYKQTLLQHGIKVLSATEPITDDPAGILIEGVFESLAMYYSAELSAKIHRGLEYNASRYMVNGKCPYGYNRSKDGFFEVNAEEACIVREIFERVANRERICDIERSINDRGILTKTGSKWTKSSFEKLLQNERYIGTYIWKDQKTEDAIPAIVDKDLFWAVQQYITTKSNPTNGRRRSDYGLYILSGKMFCSKCGTPLVGVSGTGRNGKLYFYYCCHEKCVKIPRDEIELLIAKSIKKLCMNDECVKWMAHKSWLQLQADLSESGIPDPETIEKRIKSAQASQKNILKVIESGMANDMMLDRMKELDQEVRSLKSLAESNQFTGKDVTEDDIVSYLSLFRDMDIEDKVVQEHILDAFVIKAEVFPTKVRVYFAVKQENRQVEIPLSGASEPSGSFKNSTWSIADSNR